MTDQIVENVKKKYSERSKVGVLKYKTTLTDNITDDFLKHLQEELMDATLYIEKELSFKDRNLEMVKEFNSKFKIRIAKNPRLISKEEYFLKHDLMNEELSEYFQACSSGDLVEVSDSVVDMMYVLYGIIISHGLSDVIFDMFEEVHKSNMSKLENGRVLRRSDGKVMKGSEYFKPNLKKFL